MKSEKIEEEFLNFFTHKNYKKINESPLVLEDDKSLLFTNAGMVQFKKIFLGIEKSKYNKIVTSQTCVRLGGKHNDLDTIGETPHHNTSFKMLGNFEFLNTSKKIAITLAWDFLTKILLLQKNNLYITVHKDDKETLNIWELLINIKKTHIILGTNETNFWSMDDTGPCGYCTEIFYNIEKNNNLKPKLLEIWNLVFMQFEKNKNNLKKLKHISIDTGMGLERISSVKQNVFDNFETDIYKELIETTKNLFKIKKINKNIKIITDHVKTCILLIKEGIVPSNEGRGYILKKLIRRSILKKENFEIKKQLYELTDNFVKYIDKNNSYTIYDIITIKEILKQEEIKFSYTLENGIQFIKYIIKNKKNIDSKILFMLYDTYGIPLDTIKSITKQYNITLDLKKFQIEMDKQVQKSKKQIINVNNKYDYIKNLKKTKFTGYKEIETETKILHIIKNNNKTTILNLNESGVIITEKTCFYPEKGGQIGDSGKIIKNKNIFYVTDTKEINNIYLHYGRMISGDLNINDKVITKIDNIRRQLISNNHSSTHLLHSTLKKTLGNHVKQSGSLINENYLRFDFTHINALSKENIENIENTINTYIRLNIKTNISKINKKNNVTNLEKDRIVSFGKNISEEFCAGTHVKNTNEIGLFKITKEFGIGTNIRRIEAITGKEIIKTLNEHETILKQVGEILKTNKISIIKKIINIINKNKDLEKENKKLILNEIYNEINLSQNVKIEQDIKIINIKKDKKQINIIKEIIKKFKKTIILTYSHEKEYIHISINTTNDLNIINAKQILNILKKSMQIKGGGSIYSTYGIICKKEKNIENIIKFISIYIKKIAMRKKC